MPTREEVEAARRRLGLAGAGGEPQTGVTEFRPPANISAPQQNKPKGGGITGFAKKLVTPLVDVPNLPGGKVGDIIEQGVESLTSPIGIGAALLAPVTGGSSLGLTGAGGVAARLGTRAAAEALVGGASGVAAEEVAKRIPESAPGILKIAAPLAVGAATGVAGARVASRALGGGTAAAVDDAVRKAEQLAPSTSKEADTLVEALVQAKRQMRDPEVRASLAREKGQILSNRLTAGFQRAEQLGANATPEQVQAARRSALRGELPKLDFPELNIEPDTIKALRTQAQESPRLQPFEQLDAYDALDKIFIDRVIPSNYEIKLLERAFGPALTNALSSLGTYGLKQVAADIFNLPRAIMASSDLSFGLNQGLLASGIDPKAWGESFKRSARAMADPEYAKEIDSWVRGLTGTEEHKAAANILQKMGISIAGSAATPDELFRSDRLMERVFKDNLAGRILTGSERAYVGQGNYLRTVLGEKLLNEYAKQYMKPGMSVIEGYEKIPYQTLKRIIDTVEVSTGRSTWKQIKGGGKYAPAANAFFFAPNFLVSRLQAPLLPLQSIKAIVNQNGVGALADPAALLRNDPALVAQLRMFGGMAALAAGGIGAMALYDKAGGLPGFDVELDPRSTSFMKGKWDNGAVDFLGGYSQIARTIAQVASGERKTATGSTIDQDRSEALWDMFIRSKVAPFPGLAWDVASGKTYTGERVERTPDAIERVISSRIAPIAVAEMLRGFKEGGAFAGTASGLNLLGLRVTTYTTLAQVRDGVAQEKFGKEYRDLTGKEQQEVNNHSQVLEKQREWDLVKADDFNTERDRINFERSQNEFAIAAQYLSKQIDAKEFAEAVEEQQLLARKAKDEAERRFNIVDRAPTSPAQQALDDYYSLYDLADIGHDIGVRTGRVDWNKFGELEADLRKRLTPEQLRMIDERTVTTHDPSVQWYFNNKKYISDSGYYDIVDSVFAKSGASRQFGSYSELVTALNIAKTSADKRESARLQALVRPIDKRATDAKEAMRKKDPKLDASLISIGRATKAMTPAASRLLNQ